MKGALLEPLYRISLFGELQVHSGGRIVTRFRTHRAASLLAFLAAHPDRSYSRDELAELLWPDCDSESGRNRLKQELATVRRDLGVTSEDSAGPVSPDRRSIRLNNEAVQTDIGEFRQLVSEATHCTSVEERTWKLVMAIDLVKTELLPGWTDEWVVAERAEVDAQLLEALGLAVTCHEEMGDLPAAAQYARRAIKIDPLREESHCRLMRIQLAAGQPAAAVRQYRELANVLRQELDVEPGREAHELHALCTVAEASQATAGDGQRRAVSLFNGDDEWEIAHPAPAEPSRPGLVVRTVPAAWVAAGALLALFAGYLLPHARTTTTSARDGAGSTVLPRTGTGSVAWAPPKPALAPIPIPKARIIFCRNRSADSDPDKDPAKLWTVNTNGSGLRPIFGGQSAEFEPDWSPDGKKIAFFRSPKGRRTPPHEEEICTMDPDGSHVHVLGAGVGQWPTWTADSRRILYIDFSEGLSRIYILDADGSHKHRISRPGPWSDVNPECSPDGKTILFASRRVNGSALYTMKFDGSHVTRITNPAWNISVGHWSPDGRRIAACRFSSDGYEVLRIDANGDNPLQLTHTGQCVDPIWSPDGQWIACAANLGEGNLFIMREDGSQFTRVTHVPSAIRLPAWDPRSFKSSTPHSR